MSTATAPETTAGSANGSTRRPRIAVVNDYEIVVAGLARMLEPFQDRIELTDAVLIDGQLDSPVDVALYDTFGRPGSEAEKLQQLLAKPGVRRAAVFSFDYDRASVEDALAAGAAGYVSKAVGADELVDRLERIAAGETVVDRPESEPTAELDPGPMRRGRDWPGRELGLSERESEVVALAALGRRNSEIATALYVSVDTIKSHLARSFRKLGVHNRTELAVLVHDHPSFRHRATAAD